MGAVVKVDKQSAGAMAPLGYDRMDKQHFLDVGYVDKGYFSPKLCSQDTYPDYIKENVEECVDKIQSYQSRSSITFGFMTDIHYSHTYNHNIRMLRSMNAYKEIQKHVRIDRLILGGDYTNDGNKKYKMNQYRELRAHFDDIDYFPVNGNHDDNSIWDEFLQMEKSTQHLTTEELYLLFYNHLPTKGAMFHKDNLGLYYYLDDEIRKVRYIFVDISDIPIKFDEKGKFVYTKQHTFAISQTQLDWLINEALSFKEDGWDIILVAHTLLRPSKEHEEEKGEEKYLGIINCVLDVYYKKEKINTVFYEEDFKLELKADFSNRKGRNIIGCFAGHHHTDFIEYSDSGIPYIYIGNAIMYETKPRRIDGDKSELLYDIVTIDRDVHKIYLTRVGAGDDRVAEYVV